MDLITEKKKCGTAIASIVHDDDVRTRTADRVIDITQFAANSACSGEVDTGSPIRTCTRDDVR
jgi:alpha-D-ribose 1-methylphosphonate 5-triphosphate synthase subunit PhnL